MNIAILPARSGSKRIKNKNIHKFYNKPFISHTINIIKKTKIFNQIIVSTDSKKISDISIQEGAEVPFLRSKKLSNDTCTTHEVILDVIKKINFNKNANIFCVYPTAIFLLKKDFTNALKIINKKNKNFIFCATRCSSNLQRSFIVNKNLEINKIMNKKKINKNSQDLLNLYEDLGYFYLAKSNVWLKNNSPITNKSSIIEIPKIRSVDINTYDDLKLAKILYKNKLNEK